MASASIASHADAWISSRKAAEILGDRAERLPATLEKAGVRKKALPGRHTLYYKPDVEKLRDSCVVGPGFGAAPAASVLTEAAGGGQISESRNAESGASKRRFRSESGGTSESHHTPDAPIPVPLDRSKEKVRAPKYRR